jgi:hypothetical protein
LLFSNLSPLRTQQRNYPNVFKSLLRQSDQVLIASGYISTDAAVDLKSIIEANGGPRLDLCVGMHYFDGLTPAQLEALRSLDKTLRESDLGHVSMVTTFPFHGKLVSFSRDQQILGSILGSSNLANIVEGRRQYEVDYLFEDTVYASEINEFIQKLIQTSSKPLEELVIQPIVPENNLLKDQLGVVKLQEQQVSEAQERLSGVYFDIPLKGDVSQRSGLNASFGEGRRNPQGFVLPRSWYEVELIVPKEITSSADYPKAHTDESCFDIITDDGWKFRCKVSGDYSKNLRSEDDLKILGRWMKGRLENAGVLRPGERVTDATLAHYGRSTLRMSKLKDTDVWYLDFGVKRHA